MSYFTLRETASHFVLERRGHVTAKIEIAREWFAPLSDADKVQALLHAMDRVEDHARAASLYAGPDGTDVVSRLPPLPMSLKVWDATSGMRCVEDGCKYEATESMLCPLHQRVPPCASSR